MRRLTGRTKHPPSPAANDPVKVAADTEIELDPHSELIRRRIFPTHLYRRYRRQDGEVARSAWKNATWCFISLVLVAVTSQGGWMRNGTSWLSYLPARRLSRITAFPSRHVSETGRRKCGARTPTASGSSTRGTRRTLLKACPSVIAPGQAYAWLEPLVISTKNFKIRPQLLPAVWCPRRSLTNCGTWTTRPVSRVAGFIDALAVAPAGRVRWC